jgi:hypothetical protein
MKKVICIFVCCIAVFAVTSCDNKSTSDSDKNAEIIAQEIAVTGSDGSVYHSYQNACSNGDFDAARDYIGKMKLQLASMDNVGFENKEKKEAYEKFVKEAEDYVANEEIQYLASLNEEQANNRVILILNQRSIAGLEAGEMACLGKKIEKYRLEEDDNINLPGEVRNFRIYISGCSEHNSHCNNILSIAIACGNQSLAKKILHSYRKDPELRLKNYYLERETNDEYYDVYAHYTNSSKEAAQKKYNEAVKSGAFN